ncbi:CarD family transcriptional regulator [Anaerobacillus sp. MEB173]|uniref:CarD family transcriptional regulator n=1 Tax=Anaerobacillus sp. MEB173 TaxID=3383345 RepID=UPI003F92FE21
MFEIGEKIIYPMHGSGVIEGIEEKEIQGQIEKYYVVSIPTKNLQVLIPFNKIENSGIRLVADQNSMDNVLDIFHHGESGETLSWKQRYKLNSDKMKSGKLQECAEVVRDLSRIQTEKKLNSSEKQMLDNATKILINEFGLIRGISAAEAADLLKTKQQ